ncbi:LapA family protein [Georgenia satyanarayanai]|uniref:LapA family protein n=1 Tax=Georgenia satyanarayanai TaxID=860221 RepID=UPI00203E75AF|nr:LapA family protein [Georgenia satyanarayanai]MCM3660537.1 LapA family protein [Georgenia satyanarayanai]
MRSTETERTGRVEPSTWVGLALAVLAIAFVVQNRGEVRIELFWLSVGAPMWLVLLLIFLVGWAVGALVRRRRARR